MGEKWPWIIEPGHLSRTYAGAPISGLQKGSARPAPSICDDLEERLLRKTGSLHQLAQSIKSMVCMPKRVSLSEKTVDNDHIISVSSKTSKQEDEARTFGLDSNPNLYCALASSSSYTGFFWYLSNQGSYKDHTVPLVETGSTVEQASIQSGTFLMPPRTVHDHVS